MARKTHITSLDRSHPSTGLEAHCVANKIFGQDVKLLKTTVFTCAVTKGECPENSSFVLKLPQVVSEFRLVPTDWDYNVSANFTTKSAYRMDVKKHPVSIAFYFKPGTLSRQPRAPQHTTTNSLFAMKDRCVL